jgi:hypothetical protein
MSCNQQIALGDPLVLSFERAHDLRRSTSAPYQKTSFLSIKDAAHDAPSPLLISLFEGQLRHTQTHTKRIRSAMAERNTGWLGRDSDQSAPGL